MYKINPEKHHHYAQELTAQINAAKALNIPKAQIIELVAFKEQLLANHIFNEELYHFIITTIISGMELTNLHHQHEAFILDFSRIDATVQDVYEELGIIDRLITFVGQHDYETTEYNHLFISNYIYSYYVNMSRQLLSNGDFSGFLEFITNNKRLNQYRERIWILCSNFNSLLHLGYLTKEEALTLIDRFEEEVVKDLKKQLG